MKKFFLLIFITGSAILYPEEPLKLTIENAIDLALENNYSYRLSQEQVNQYKKRLMQSLVFLPQVSVDALFKAPHHPYTMGLMNSIPSAQLPGGKLVPIPGQPPNMAHLPAGCRFSPRCAFATEDCRVGEFPLRQVGSNHFSACIKDLRPGQ